MYLTHLQLPLAHRAVQKLISNPYSMHQFLMSGLPFPAGRALYRIEPLSNDAKSAIVLVQTQQEPKWLVERIPPNSKVATKAVGAAFETLCNGQRLRFRLRANPTKKQKCEGKDQGRRVALVHEEDQLKWLARKGETCGFELAENSESKTPACVIRDDKELIAHKPGGAPPLTYRSVLFEGTLKIRDVKAFRNTLFAGMGSGKAFGFGLLSVARI